MKLSQQSATSVRKPYQRSEGAARAYPSPLYIERHIQSGEALGALLLRLAAALRRTGSGAGRALQRTIDAIVGVQQQRADGRASALLGKTARTHTLPRVMTHAAQTKGKRAANEDKFQSAA